MASSKKIQNTRFFFSLQYVDTHFKKSTTFWCTNVHYKLFRKCFFFQVANYTQVQTGIQETYFVTSLCNCYGSVVNIFHIPIGCLLCSEFEEGTWRRWQATRGPRFLSKIAILQTPKPRKEARLPSLKPHLLLRTILPPHYLLSLAYTSTGIYQLSCIVYALLWWFYFISRDGHKPNHVSRNVNLLNKSPLIHVCMEKILFI